MNVAPNVFAGPDVSIRAGDSFQRLGSFTDPGDDVWTASVDYGDGSGPQELPLTAEKTFELTHAFPHSGDFAVTVTVADEDGDVSQDELLVHVRPVNEPPVIETMPDATIDEGKFWDTTGRFADPNEESWSGTVDYGDGKGLQALMISDKTFALGHTYAGNGNYAVSVMVSDGAGGAGTFSFWVTVNNLAPTLADAELSVAENSPNGTLVGGVAAADSGDDTIAYEVIGGTGSGEFHVDPETGQVSIRAGSRLDFERLATWTLELRAIDDDQSISNTATVTIHLQNQPSITGAVFVDIDRDGLYDANEAGIDHVVIQLLDANGDPVLDDQNNPITAITSDGGFYLFDDLRPGTYRIREVQPTGVDDGREILGSLGGSIPANDTMQLTLQRADAHDYVFAELGRQVAGGDAAGIGFWQNKHGQELIKLGGTALAGWLTTNLGNVFGNEFVGGDGNTVAAFFKDQLFKQKGKNAAGPAKVDAQFMAVALATYFTSSNLAGSNVAAGYGFHVTETGIGAKLVNVADNGAAFGADNGADLTVMQLLLATSRLAARPVSGACIYDRNGDGLIDAEEGALRAKANAIYELINEQGDI